MADERSDASTGGTEAPPPKDAPNRAPSDLTREYEGRGIRVQWYAGRCIHTGDCVRAIPAVFNPRRRPWIDLSAAEAEADAVAEAVLRCPTGALHFERFDGGPQESVEPGVRAKPIRNGPLLLRGDVEVFDESGQLLRRDTRVAICRCGRSQHMPFCDNSHRAKIRP
ncbi:MAG TPA: CDGSH iron-sulfur domain-containing protein [Thermoanaerobaculia bacterium]|nr:CDGSH iron-sulfur domain-containing protein [Thermoanaerobaculia bacterium]